MEADHRSHQDLWIAAVATAGGVGRLPVAPGTAASLVGMAAMMFLQGFSTLIQGGILAVVLVLGFLSAGRMERLEGRTDPPCVVIDEVAGVMIALWGLPQQAAVLITAFFLFRAFDMFKIFPVNLLERCHGATGIMLDDVIAGVYTNLAMRLGLLLGGWWFGLSP